MTEAPSAEAIVNLCQQRGLRGFDLAKLKACLANRLSDKKFAALLKENYLMVARGGDDSEALRWFSDMRQAVVEEPVPQHKQIPKRGYGGPNYKAFGSSAALTFEIDDLRAQDGTGAPLKTVAIEAAKAIAVRAYNWDDKVILQLMQNEVPLFVGAMLGMCSRWDASGHGAEHNKSIKVERQKEGVHVVVTQGSRVMSVSVPNGVAFHVASLGVLAIQSQHPHLTADAVLSMCSRVCEGN